MQNIFAPTILKNAQNTQYGIGIWYFISFGWKISKENYFSVEY